LRIAMRGSLPEPVCRRPKTPLVFDPCYVRLQQPDARWIDNFEPTPALPQYITRENVPRLAGGICDSDTAYTHLRPLILNYWLEALDGSTGDLN
jgi:hypothetical protein